MKRTISSATLTSPALDTLIEEISSLTLTSLNVTTPKERIVESKNASILSHFDHFMSQRKMHEVYSDVSFSSPIWTTWVLEILWHINVFDHKLNKVLMMSDTMSALCERENVS